MKQISMHAKLHKASVEVTVIDELGVVHSLLWCFKNDEETQTLVTSEEEESITEEVPSVEEQTIEEAK